MSNPQRIKVFLGVLWNSIKLDNELRCDFRDLIFFIKIT